MLASSQSQTFIGAFKALSLNEQKEVIAELLQLEAFYEDLTDVAIVRERRTEPTISLQSYLQKRSSDRQ